MAESKTHMEIVNQVYTYISDLLDDDELPMLQVDTPTSINKPSKVIGNFHPDVYYVDSKKLIIGEAKTDADAETSHSIEQYKAYISEGKLFGENVTIVIGVYFYGYPSLLNRFRNLKRTEDFNGKIIILDSTGRMKEI